MQFLVLDILRHGCKAQVRDSVVGDVSVDMVEVHSFRWKFSVKMEPRDLMSVILHFGDSYERIAGSGFCVTSSAFSSVSVGPFILAGKPSEDSRLWIIIEKLANLFSGKLNKVRHD